jgi:hypothetical protein
MNSHRELKLVYGLAILLFVVGIFSYAITAFSAKPPDDPIRIMYQTAAGKVLFDHKTHYAPTGYAVSCYDCHHHPPEDEMALRACGDCHTLPENRELAVETCIECHDEDIMDYVDMLKRADAFHVQCVDCHNAVGAGPVDCNSCHVL